MIALPIMMLDVEYCFEAANDMCEQASMQESMAALNPNHLSVKNDILRSQGKALLSLCEYVKTLKEVDKLKIQMLSDQKDREKINRMFI